MFSVESQGAVSVLRAIGALNHENAHGLTETIEKGLPGGQPMIVLDLSEVPLVDSAGLETLVDIQQSVQSHGGNFKLACPNQLCQEIFRITKVDALLDAYPDVKAAVGSFVR